MPNIYTGGTFDLFHAGHVDFLATCHRLAGTGSVTVVLNTDDFVERFKGTRPANTLAQRRDVVAACRYVTFVRFNTGDESSGSTIESVKPDMIVIGSDWYGRDYLGQLGVTMNWLGQHNIALTFVPRIIDMSTTAVRRTVVTRYEPSLTNGV